MQQWVKNETAQIMVIAVATAVGAEFMINPFSGDFFRIGLGVSIFLFLLLFSSHLNYFLIGAATGAMNIVVQAGEWLLHNHSADVFAALQNNAAAGFYYMVFAIGMSRIRLKIHVISPLLLGVIVAGIDLASNLTELFVRGILLGTEPFSLSKMVFLAFIALVRSYFVIGLYSSVTISQVRSLQSEQQKRMEQMLTVGSSLYGEAFYLKKSMNTIEQITVDSFGLYQALKENGQSDYSRQALGIAQQIHEVKKDSQRILAGLLKLVDIETVGAMSISEMIRYVIKGNQEYSTMLGKRIRIEENVHAASVTPYYMPLLTVLNNLAANAVESIEQEGTIRIQAAEQHGELLFRVSDSGHGITPQDEEMIFEPGFTTKYSDQGVAATGIGLSHVRDIVHFFGGRIVVERCGETGGAAFLVYLPIDAIRNGGKADESFFRDRR